jgi:hypothetical protein
MCVTHKEFLNYTTWLCETFALAINQEIERTGKRTTQLTIMLDFEHFSMRQMASKQGIFRHTFQVSLQALHNSQRFLQHKVLEALLDMIRTYLINYPKSFRRVFVVNGTSLIIMCCVHRHRP